MDSSDCLSDDERSGELATISCIFPEIKIDPSSPYKASLDLEVVPSKPLHVWFQQNPSDVDFPTVLTPPTSVDASDSGFELGNKVGLESSTNNNANETYAISHLPPLNIAIELPEGYPSEEAPNFTLTTTPAWLPSSVITKLLDDGRALWEELGKSSVVFSYIDHLRHLSETVFGIDDGTDGGVRLPLELKVPILDFTSKAERAEFEQGTFECGVCLEPKKGVNCHRLLHCSHVFCVPCLQDFYNTCITEGDVDGVKCLAPDCSKEQAPESPGISEKTRKKKDRTLSPSELLEIPLTQETVQRYVFLKRKKKLEADRTTVYCPRKWCQGAARSKRHPKPVDPMSDDFDASDEEDDRPSFDPLGDEAQLPAVADRLAVCEDCDYAFCCVCKKGWHGELVRCFPRREAELSAEEKATEEYLRKYTSACPTCSAPCQKQMGCNHMKCFKCDTHFCYLCSSWLIEDNPYRHFNDINSGCYNRLWDLEGGDGINPVGAQALHEIPPELLEFDDSSSDDEDHPVWEFDDSDDELGRRRRPPPPAPFPPRAAGGAGNGDRGRNAQVLDAAVQAAEAERQAQARAMAEMRGRPEVGQQQPRHDPGRGIQRFLDLVRNDREDEWDSDELDDDF